jgi:ABC-type multidrug transport system fused ATPase/permease subunit
MDVGNDVAQRIWEGILSEPYEAHLYRNGAEVLGGLENLRQLSFMVLEPAMQGLAASVLSIMIAAFLLAVDPVATSIFAGTALAIYVLTGLATQSRLRRNSAELAAATTARIKVVQEGLGAIRDVILSRSQGVFQHELRQILDGYRHAYVSNSLIAVAPRFLLEAGGVAAIVCVALVASSRPEGLMGAIPILGALALGGQRLLPLLQQAFAGWSRSAGNTRSLADVVALMMRNPMSAGPADNGMAIGFANEITFNRVSFQYRNRPPAVEEVSFSIRRGERVGIDGESGAGKSTVLDLLMGLLVPTTGEIRIDGVLLGDSTRLAWQARIAHVPQSIYLMDDTIAANIAFGVAADRIDGKRLRDAAEAAYLQDFIESLSDGYNTRVGERGLNLSGGQRQRVGIARALYARAEILILDEATNALDDEAEAAILDAIANLGRDITLIAVAHRRSSLARCDQVITLPDRRKGDKRPAGAEPRA